MAEGARSPATGPVVRVFTPHVARWSVQRRGELLITDIAGKVVQSFTVSPPPYRPYASMLQQTGWCAYPGAEWEEEPPGQWSRTVFRESADGRAGEV